MCAFFVETVEAHQTQLRERRRGIGRGTGSPKAKGADVCVTLGSFILPGLPHLSRSAVNMDIVLSDHAQAGIGYRRTRDCPDHHEDGVMVPVTSPPANPPFLLLCVKPSFVSLNVHG